MVAYWLSKTRYYRAEIKRDLLGDLVLDQHWGGRGSRLGGHKTVLILDEEEGRSMIDAIDRIRIRHRYRRIDRPAVRNA